MSAVLDAIGRHAERRGDAPALAGGGVVYGYRSVAEAVQLAADALSSRLSQAPGCVAVQLRNSVRWVLTDLALLRLRRASAPLPEFFTSGQIAHALADSGADWILSDNGPGDPVAIGEGVVFLQRLQGNSRRLPPDTAKVTYTSGSTGAPKGLCLSRDQIEAVASGIVERLGAEFAGVHMPVLPLAILLENVAGLYPILLAGGCYRIKSSEALGLANPFKPDFAVLGDALVAGKATTLILVPELLRGMLAARAFGVMAWPNLSFVAVGGAKLAPELIVAARGAGLPVFEGYGLSECASVVSLNTPSKERVGSVGKPLRHLEVTIAADGEIIVGPEALQSYAGGAQHKGKVHTGDIGYLDDDGFLHVTGRKSNLIITSFGRNVSPEWVESELQAEPEIRHAVVYGEASSSLSALIAPSFSGLESSQIAASVSRANERLPAYAQVKRFDLIAPLSVSEGQLTGNGRIKRHALMVAYDHLVKRRGDTNGFL